MVYSTKQVLKMLGESVRKSGSPCAPPLDDLWASLGVRKLRRELLGKEFEASKTLDEVTDALVWMGAASGKGQAKKMIPGLVTAGRDLKYDKVKYLRVRTSDGKDFVVYSCTTQFEDEIKTEATRYL